MNRGADDLKAEAIRRLRPDVDFIIIDGETIKFPNNDAKRGNIGVLDGDGDV